MDTLLNYYTSADTFGEDTILDYLDPNKEVSTIYAEVPFTNFGFAASVCIVYLAFVVFGSAIMKFLPPIDPYALKFIYNLSQMILCSCT